MKTVIGAGVIIAAALVAWLVVAGQSRTTSLPSDKITVAASIFPLADITENIGGERVRVVQLLPSGASPHSYTLTPSQVADIQDAKALFVIGHSLDTWATQAVAKAANIPMVIVDNDIALQEFGTKHEDDPEDEHEEGSIDPHYWLTIPNAQKIAKTIGATLQNADPEHSNEYQSNLQDYLGQLDQAEAELQTMSQQANDAKFIAIHDAWGYFADHYSLELVATYEPIEGREPSIREIQELRETIAAHNIDTFFTEPQKQSIGATRFLQQDLGLNIKILDPVGGIGSRDSYINMMRENVKAIVEQ